MWKGHNRGPEKKSAKRRTTLVAERQVKMAKLVDSNENFKAVHLVLNVVHCG